MTRADGIPELARAAQAGDVTAWERLVAEFTPLLRRVARSYGLQHHDVDDAVQLVWMRAWASIGNLHEPAAIAGWLITTTRRCALRVRQAAERELPVDALGEDDPARGPSVDQRLIEQERAAALHAAIGRLPQRQRTIVEALLGDLPGGYQQIAEEIRMPIGSIGPTRARSFARLRGDAELACVCAA
jgi:RNA polymerase sigma factor (sigma-70 family)